MPPRKKIIETIQYVIDCDVCGEEGIVAKDSNVTTCPVCRRKLRKEKSLKVIEDIFLGATIVELEAYDGNDNIARMMVKTRSGEVYEVYPKQGSARYHHIQKVSDSNIPIIVRPSNEFDSVGE